jgi:glycosyltransferase involved in cell wall biosynthesis
MNDTLPLVSIITPAYNRASYLDETIRSVLEQDYPRIEYIVLDDGSTDNTREVLEKYTGRLIWETHPNMGEHRTVNKGWSMAHGEIVAVVNSDDTLLPGAVSTAVAFMQAHPDILVAYPDWNFIGPDSEFISHVQVPEYDYLYMLKHYHSIVGGGAFIRRKAFELAGMRDPDFKYVADFEYWLRLGLYGKFARIPKTLATWRVHPGSAWVSGNGKAMADEHVRLVEKLYSRPDLPPEVLRVRREAFSSAHYFAVLTAGPARWEARKHCLKSFLYHPPSLFGNNEKLMIALSLMLPRPLFKTPLWRRMVRPILARGYRFIKQLRKRLRA